MDVIVVQVALAHIFDQQEVAVCTTVGETFSSSAKANIKNSSKRHHRRWKYVLPQTPITLLQCMQCLFGLIYIYTHIVLVIVIDRFTFNVSHETIHIPVMVITTVPSHHTYISTSSWSVFAVIELCAPAFIGFRCIVPIDPSPPPPAPPAPPVPPSATSSPLAPLGV